MSRLKLIIKREFIAKVRNKTFLIMTILSPVLVFAMIALIVFLGKVNQEDVKTVAYIDQSDLFSEQDFQDTKTLKFIELTNDDIDIAMMEAEVEGHYGVLFIPEKDSITDIASNVQFFSSKSPNIIFISSLEQLIKNRLQNLRLENHGIDIQRLNELNVQVNISLSNYIGEESSKLESGLKIGIGMAAGYLIMMFIIIYGASVMRSVIEEKTSRIIEVIISSVKPFQLMMGKITGTALAGLLQFSIWGVLLLIIGVISSYFFGIDRVDVSNVNMSDQEMEAMKVMANGGAQEIFAIVEKLPLFITFISFIVYFICGYLLYSSIYAAIGAAVDNETDSQQFMLPIMIPLVLGVYIGFASVISDPHGPIATIFSMIPFTSPIVMLMRIPFGVPWWQVLVSLSLLIITFLMIVWFAAKIYKVGILMYGKKPTYKEIYRWLKY